MQRIFTSGNIQNIHFPTKAEQISYGSYSNVIIYKSYDLLNMLQFLAHPVDVPPRLNNCAFWWLYVCLVQLVFDCSID